jgi:hypothetical protein
MTQQTLIRRGRRGRKVLQGEHAATLQQTLGRRDCRTLMRKRFACADAVQEVGTSTGVDDFCKCFSELFHLSAEAPCW